MWEKLCFSDERLEAGINKIINRRLGAIDAHTGLITPMDAIMYPDPNWIFFGYTTGLRDCYLWHSIMFDCFDLVPEFCKLRCYKVVVKVRNFLEAIKFRAVMEASPHYLEHMTPMHGKVGIDERFYSDGHFNGFIYCDGPEDAQMRYEATRKLVDEHIPNGKEIDIIIKRTCTEFERRYGATDQPFWQSMTEDELDLQRHIEDICLGRKDCAVQPDWLKNKTILKFAKWANTVGDKTWVDYYGQDWLTMKAITYHLNTPKKGEGGGSLGIPEAKEEKPRKKKKPKTKK